MAARKKSAKRSDGRIAVTQDRLLGSVHQVWLAGLGAVSKAQTGAPRLLDELVTEGTRVQARASKATDAVACAAMNSAKTAARGRVEEVRENAADAFENLEKIFQTRVHRALKQLGVPSAEEIASLSKRVDALNTNIEKLARKRQSVQKPRTNAARKRTPQRRAAH